MHARTSLLVASVLVAMVLSNPSSADTIHLQANFDDKTLDAPIGAGGPELGEPIYVDFALTATVRATPMSSPCLEIQDISDEYGGIIDFEFLDDAEITTGVVTITFDLWFYELSPGYRFRIYVREQGTGSSQFLTLQFDPVGAIQYYDTDTHTTLIGVYETGRSLPVELVFDMDAGTYDVMFDGLLLLDDEEHGVVGRGIGSVIPSCQVDPDLDGRFCIDNLLVTETDPSAIEPATWGAIKALF